MVISNFQKTVSLTLKKMFFKTIIFFLVFFLISFFVCYYLLLYTKMVRFRYQNGKCRLSKC